MESGDFLFWCIWLAFGSMIASFIICLVRLLKGPTAPDRVVALDMISVVMMGFTALFLLLYEKFIFMDVIGTVALISFLGTVAYVVHLEKELQDGMDR